MRDALDPLSRHVVDLHAAARLADAGAIDRAIELASPIRDAEVLERVGCSPVGSVGIHSAAGSGYHTTCPYWLGMAPAGSSTRDKFRRGRTPERARIAVTTLAATSDFLGRSFADIFTPSSTRSMNWSSEDPIGNRAQGVLFSARNGAPIGSSVVGFDRDARTVHPHLRRSQGRRDAYVQGLHLLRRSGDEKSVRIACERLRLQGPLGALQSIAVEIATMHPG